MASSPENLSLIAKMECTQIVQAFAYFVDNRMFTEAVNTFSEDGVFVRPGHESKGRSEISDIWKDRPEHMRTRHVCCPTYFTQLNSDNAAGVTMMTLYHVEHHGEGLPAFDRPAAIVEFHDKFLLTDAGWKISHRQAIPKMIAKD